MPAKLIALVQGFVFLLTCGLALFVGAGRLDVPEFWLYFASIVAASAASFFLVDPDLIEERVRPAGRSVSALYALALLWPLAHWTVAGLDRRYHWSDTVPLWFIAIALIAIAASWCAGIWAARVNRFASSAVRIQHDRGHQVITVGPYALVRHPMYLAGLVVIMASGIALGSWLAAAIAAPSLPLLVWRTIHEDGLLQAELPGYREYAQRVPYRIIPGIW
jgi:protein-S-isoprenylcysteine O-methyltransferase Ste14